MRSARRADVVCACAIACDVSVADLSYGAELYGYLHLDILAYSKYALSRFNAAAEFSARRNGGFAATFDYGQACFCERRYGNGYADRRHLIGYGRAGLIFNR